MTPRIHGLNRSRSYFAFTFVLLASCTSTRMSSSPRNFYFAEGDTLYITGFNTGQASLREQAEPAMSNAMSGLKGVNVVDSYEYRKLLFRAGSAELMQVNAAQSIAKLKELKRHGYILQATIVASSDENSLLSFTPQQLGQRAGDFNDPWIEFRFDIYHIQSATKVLTSVARVRNNSIIVGETGDTDIGINRGINERNCIHELNKALKKLKKVCRVAPTSTHL